MASFALFWGKSFSVSSSVLTQWQCQHPLLVSQREKHFKYVFNVGFLELPNQQPRGAQKMKPLMIPEVWKPSPWPHSLTDRWNCFHKALHIPLRGEGLSQLLQAAAWSSKLVFLWSCPWGGGTAHWEQVKQRSSDILATFLCLSNSPGFLINPHFVTTVNYLLQVLGIQ